ncbi:MAG: glycosyltransferase [Candidatus Cloacimonetes bacterium]|nr:glycosyltransferase [Candidatus Cloacimonadota bacterium]
MNGNKLLMIINEFPPTGLSGVQRALKFLKYACREGWEVHAVVPARPVRKETDPSLLEEIPAAAHIHRVSGLGIKSRNVSRITSTRFADTRPKNPLKRGFWALLKFLNDLLWPIDKQIGWMPFAAIKAASLIRRHGIRNIYITAWPFSSFLAGISLKKRFGQKIFWAADYRDAWQFAPLLDQKVHPFRKRRIAQTDAKVLQACDKAVFVTPQIRDRYLARYPWLEGKAEVITNGFDEDDFAGLAPVPYPEPTLVYMGRMDRNYGDPLKLLEGIAGCPVPGLGFVHLGSADPQLLERIGQNGYRFYTHLGYLPHKQALAHALGAWVNIIMLADNPASEQVYTGKLFELLRAGKPILSVGPQRSVIAGLLDETGAGLHVHIADPQAISAALERLLADPPRYDPNSDLIKRFSRAETTRQLLRLFP